MSTTRDWFPTSRDEQLAMGKNWTAILTDRGAEWNVPPGEVQELSALVEDADTILAMAKNETTRTPVVTAQCRETFRRLEEKMRYIKKRFFYIPPLAEADIAALGLRLADTIKTPSKRPSAQVTVETYLAGRHELGVKIIYQTGSPDDKANKGYRIYYKVIGPEEKAPPGPEDLPKSFFTKRRKDIIRFEYGDSGKTVYLAVQIENDGKKGDWGTMSSALIP
jgi:hypothetical protein